MRALPMTVQVHNAGKPRDRQQLRLPGFIAVGPPRTGTTWLHGLLYRCACVPRELKETNYFTDFYDLGPQWYSVYFDYCDSTRPMGEVSPAYFGSELARERICHDLPQCKIICTLREPVARAWSYYRKLASVGRARAGFEGELRINPRLRESSRYGAHLGAWVERFGAGNVGVFFYDDLESNPQQFYGEICHFIGVEPVQLTPEISRLLIRNEVVEAPRLPALAARASRLQHWLQRHHAHRVIANLRWAGFWRFCFSGGEKFRSLEPEVEAQLREYFLPEVEAVEELTGRDLTAWKPMRNRSSAAAASGR
jgi:hypothetical protein